MADSTEHPDVARQTMHTPKTDDQHRALEEEKKIAATEAIPTALPPEKKTKIDKETTSKKKKPASKKKKPSDKHTSFAFVLRDTDEDEYNGEEDFFEYLMEHDI